MEMDQQLFIDTDQQVQAQNYQRKILFNRWVEEKECMVVEEKEVL